MRPARAASSKALSNAVGVLTWSALAAGVDRLSRAAWLPDTLCAAGAAGAGDGSTAPTALAASPSFSADRWRRSATGAWCGAVGGTSARSVWVGGDPAKPDRAPPRLGTEADSACRVDVAVLASTFAVLGFAVSAVFAVAGSVCAPGVAAGAATTAAAGAGNAVCGGAAAGASARCWP